MLSLKNKTILITGASSGIGKACAELFAAQHAKLILIARNIAKLNAVADDLRSRYDATILTIELDVSSWENVNTKLLQLPTAFESVEILINNAGGALGLDKVIDADIKQWDQMIDVNIKGLLYVTRTLLPAMVKRNQGHIVNIGSLAGHRIYEGGSVYCATKHAVNALTRTLRLELGQTALRVSEIDPGMVETEFSTVRFSGDAERAAKVYESLTPLSAEDVAEIVSFCVTRPLHVNISELIVTPQEQSNKRYLILD